jgi:SAM-dependent MidA family methyltransferase
VRAIDDEIARHGSISFGRFMELALYGAEGFYTRGGGAGRRRDFVTSVEVGPLFGAVLARALDAWWDELGQPAPFTVVEAGAGRAQLARSILRANPRCASALRYVLVEVAPSARAEHPVGLPHVVPSQVFATPAGGNDDDAAVGPPGPLVTSLGELPVTAIDGVVLANELLDNLAFDLYERRPDGWCEVRICRREDGLSELLVPADAVDLDAPAGARVPIQRAAQGWLRDALGVVRRGRVVVIDYTATTAELATRSGWLRTYAEHTLGSDPLRAPGHGDITADVCIDQLAAVRAPTQVRSQADFLRAHGIDELVLEGRARWAAAANAPDVAALAARSRVGEAAALLDPAGLGGFTVLEYEVAGWTGA